MTFHCETHQGNHYLFIFFFSFLKIFYWIIPLQKGMATLSSILAWRIPWTEEPGGLQSMGSQRVGDSGVTDTLTFIADVQCCVSFRYKAK